MADFFRLGEGLCFVSGRGQRGEWPSPLSDDCYVWHFVTSKGQVDAKQAFAAMMSRLLTTRSCLLCLGVSLGSRTRPRLPPANGRVFVFTGMNHEAETRIGKPSAGARF
jgi:hypothetical protein